VRMGELVVTVVSVDDESVGAGYTPSSSPAGYHDVAVHVKIENVSNQFPCTNLNAFLQAEPYNEYHQSWAKGHWASLEELLPGQVIGIDYVFSVRDGTPRFVGSEGREHTRRPDGRQSKM
jgi:hypothetical protein